MSKNLFHEEIITRNGMAHKTIVLEAVELGPNMIEISAADTSGNEKASVALAGNTDEAYAIFTDLIERYAHPLQKAFFCGFLIPGNRYTLVCFSDFGFPVALHFTHISASFETYAQYDDAVGLVMMPERKRKPRIVHLCNSSFAIYEGWRDLKDDMVYNARSSTVYVSRMSKYPSFDQRYMQDIESAWPDYLVAYDHTKPQTDAPEPQPEKEPERFLPCTLAPGLTVLEDEQANAGIVVAMSADDFAAMYSREADMMASQIDRLTMALRRAAVASAAHITDEDGGTCNFDSPALDYVGCGLHKEEAKQAIESAGLHGSDWSMKYSHDKYLLINGFMSGQANRRSSMAQAFCDSLNADGFPAIMYCQMD